MEFANDIRITISIGTNVVSVVLELEDCQLNQRSRTQTLITKPLTRRATLRAKGAKM